MGMEIRVLGWMLSAIVGAVVLSEVKRKDSGVEGSSSFTDPGGITSCEPTCVVESIVGQGLRSDDRRRVIVGLKQNKWKRLAREKGVNEKSIVRREVLGKHDAGLTWMVCV
ncbi:hypothetical protein ACOSQ2_029102 [Xanthoceras sorbifolium]